MKQNKLIKCIERIKSNTNLTIGILILGIILTVGSISIVKKNVVNVGYTLKIIETEKDIIEEADNLGSLGNSYIYKKELKDYEKQRNKEYIYIFIGIVLIISGIFLSVIMIYFLNLNSALNKEKKLNE